VRPPSAGPTPPAEGPPPLDAPTLRKALAGAPAGPAAAALADKLRRWFGEEPLRNGAAKMEGLDVVFALEAPGAKAVTAQSIDGLVRRKLAAIGEGPVWAAVETLADGTALRFSYSVDGRTVGSFGVETFAPPPDSLPRAGVPRGKVIKQKRLGSKVWPGSERDWWIYVPAQYRAGKPVAVMVFQDGEQQYLKQTPTVFDNLIQRGDMPVTAAVFINPGVYADGRRNRSIEYDTLSDAYARFLLEEVFPEVEKTVKIRKEPEARAIAGMSSGGICAFTVAWQRPDQFRKVLSWVGSFVNIAGGESGLAGGHNYPPMIRKSPRKPIRVFLQDGEQDLEQEAGSWSLANREMDRALIWAGWDAKAVFGRGFHTPRHGSALFPDSLRWLWRDWRETLK
jgi:enterochelin esterase family protein